MNIIYSSSDAYSELAGVSITSLFENNKNIDDISVYIIDNGISEKNKENFHKIANLYHRSIIFLPKIDIEKTLKVDIYTGRWNIGTFFRLYLGTILPKEIDRVLYLDCDTIVRGNLNELYNTDLGKCIVAGVDDCRSPLYRKELGLKDDSIYINNGVLLVDLEKWRKNSLEEEFSNFIKKHKGDCTYMDQAPLNSILGKRDLIYELPSKYNAQRVFFDFSYDELLNLRKPLHHLSKEEYIEAINSPIIVHFTPVFISGTRPWQVKDNHKFRNEYLHYKSISPWKDVPLRKDDRKFCKKIMTTCCKILPRFLLIRIMSYLHAKWYPNKRNKLANKLEKE